MGKDRLCSIARMGQEEWGEVCGMLYSCQSPLPANVFFF
jgi:hypothetical protein